MKIEYDNYYQVENLFGSPYPELLDFYSKIKVKGKLVDLGCGQGRDSIPLAKLGFTVTGIDNSKVGIEQLNDIAKKANLALKGLVEDIYSYSNFNEFDFILLDSMFHFDKKNRTKEINFLNRLLTESKTKTVITICIQDVGKKVATLHSIISSRSDIELTTQTELIYKYVDRESNHSSETKYAMIVIEKKQSGMLNG